MKTPVIQRFLTLLISLLCYSWQLSAQCSSGYTSAAINWDLQYFNNSVLPSSGIYFMIGINSMQLKWSGSNTFNGVTGSHTGESASFGSGEDIKFTVGNGADTLIFDSEVKNLKFSVYDLDKSQKLSVTATNASGAAQNITIAKVSGSILTISGSGTSTASATASSSSAANNSSDGTANITISGPVSKVVLTFTKSSWTDDIYISDVSACINGNWPNNYTAGASPEEGQDTLLLVSYSDSTIYVLDKTSQTAVPLYKDPYIREPNSLAFDSYNQVIYYCDGTYFSPSNKSIYRYSVKTGIRDTFINDVTTLGIQVFSGGLASGGASFYDGALFVGQEPYAQDEPNAVWKIDIDSVTGDAIKASRVWSKLGYDNSGILYNWADFVIKNGVIYNFNVGAKAAANTNIEHIDLNAQTVTVGYTYSGVSQSAMDFLGNIYLMKANSYALYNEAGGFGSTVSYSGVTSGAAIIDAAEAYKNPYDFGDAPTSYGSAYHLYKKAPDLMLGTKIDYYVRGVSNSNASADDIHNTGAVNDEDAVTSFPILTDRTVNYAVALSVTNNTGADAMLYGYIDFNIDGDFDDEYERSNPTTVPNGTTSAIVNWTGLPGQVVGNSFVRFRLASSAAQAINPTGYAATGEVEDYPISIVGSSLPVELVNFSGKTQDDHTNLLHWSTASEKNNAYFVIERSSDFVRWDSIGVVPGHGNSHELLSYDFIDKQPKDSLNYYRLKQVDFGGAFDYSPCIVLYDNSGSYSLLQDDKDNIVVYPNPVKDILWVRSTGNSNAELQLEQYNLSGEKMGTSKMQNNAGKMDISNYAKGVYILRIGDQNFKVIKE